MAAVLHQNQMPRRTFLAQHEILRRHHRFFGDLLDVIHAIEGLRHRRLFCIFGFSRVQKARAIGRRVFDACAVNAHRFVRQPAGFLLRARRQEMHVHAGDRCKRFHRLRGDLVLDRIGGRPGESVRTTNRGRRHADQRIVVAVIHERIWIAANVRVGQGGGEMLLQQNAQQRVRDRRNSIGTEEALERRAGLFLIASDRIQIQRRDSAPQNAGIACRKTHRAVAARRHQSSNRAFQRRNVSRFRARVNRAHGFHRHRGTRRARVGPLALR